MLIIESQPTTLTTLIGNDIVSSELYEKISLLVMRLKLDMSPTEFIDTVRVARGLEVKEGIGSFCWSR